MCVLGASPQDAVTLHFALRSRTRLALAPSRQYLRHSGPRTSSLQILPRFLFVFLSFFEFLWRCRTRYASERPILRMEELNRRFSLLSALPTQCFFPSSLFIHGRFNVAPRKAGQTRLCQEIAQCPSSLPTSLPRAIQSVRRSAGLGVREQSVHTQSRSECQVEDDV